jgi:hypothetical protein
MVYYLIVTYLATCISKNDLFSYQRTFDIRRKLNLLDREGLILTRHSGYFGGGEGDRTPDLRNANPALSQLSYAPVKVGCGDRI